MEHIQISKGVGDLIISISGKDKTLSLSRRPDNGLEITWNGQIVGTWKAGELGACLESFIRIVSEDEGILLTLSCALEAHLRTERPCFN